MKYFVLYLLFQTTFFCAGQDVHWTWLHHKIFNEKQRTQNKNRKQLTYEKKDVPAFNQLMFSWNAFRPKKGHFSFSAQVRDSITHKWSRWYKMMDWGMGIQQSYATQHTEPVNHVHVRLEMGKRHADAFRIKIESVNGADASLMRSFAISVSDHAKFAEESTLYELPSVFIKDVPQWSQFALDHPRNAGLCSPTSCAMLISYLMKKPIDVIDFAEKAYDHGLCVYGSWPFNLAHAFEICNGKVRFSVARLHSFKQLYERLVQSIPVCVSVRGPLAGSATAYASGHLLLVVGWDNDTKEVICHDPAFQPHEPVEKRYKLKDFLVAWERSRRLAYCAEMIFE